MTLETVVQELTNTTQSLINSTESLLQSVNVRKVNLDAAETNASASAIAAEQNANIATAQATTATAKANLLGSTASVVAAGTVDLTSASAVYQLINPNGAARDVTLPDLTADDAGRAFVIKNTGVTYALTVKIAAGTQLGPLIANGYASAYVWSGTDWEAI